MTLTPERIAEIARDERVVARFLAAVDSSDHDGCWPWTKGVKVTRCGHRRGVFNAGGAHHFAARFAYVIAHGLIPVGMLVCHTCDNPICVRPSHLFLGTHRDNAIDCLTKGRHPSQTGTHNVARGQLHPCAKLTAEQVAEIRNTWSPGYGKGRLAKTYGVSLGAIKSILTGRSWSDGKRVALVVLEDSK